MCRKDVLLYKSKEEKLWIEIKVSYLKKVGK